MILRKRTLLLASLMAAAPVWAQTTGVLSYAPSALVNGALRVPIPTFLLLPLSIALAVIGLRCLRRQEAGLLGLLLTCTAVASLTTTATYMHRVTAAAAVVELDNPAGGTVDVPFGLQAYSNTSGVAQVITGITPPDNCGSDPVTTLCTAGMTLPVDGLCETAYSACPPEVSITATADGFEGDTPTAGRFTLSRTGDTSGPLTVTYSLAGSAAHAGDYTVASTTTVTFAAGQATVDIEVTVLDDTVYDPKETVELSLVDGPDYDLGAPASDSLTIVTQDKYLYVTSQAARTVGDLGGVAGADTRCNTDAFHPGDGRVFKAVLAGGGRSAVPQTDWALQAGYRYFRTYDNVYVGRADVSAQLPFPISSFAGSEIGTRIWTGLEGDWTSAAANCLGWTDGSGAEAANIGGAFKTSASLIDASTVACDGLGALLCVEQ